MLSQQLFINHPISGLHVDPHTLSEMNQQWVPLFRVDASALVLIEPIAGSGLMEFDHERLHIIQLKVCLAFRARVDNGQDGRIVEVDIAVVAIFFERRCQTGPILLCECTLYAPPFWI